MAIVTECAQQPSNRAAVVRFAVATIDQSVRAWIAQPGTRLSCQLVLPHNRSARSLPLPH